MTNGTLALGGSSIWTDMRFRAVLIQTIIFAVIILLFAVLTYNTAQNLEKLGKGIDFWFLTQPAGFEISFSLIPFSATDSHGMVYVVGLLNTLFVSALGCVIATILGFIMGVLRLSHNWLVERIIYCFVEFTRNVPLLLQIIFWYTVLLGLPTLRNSLELGSSFYLNNRGLFGPAPDFGAAFVYVVVALAVGIVAAIVVGKWAHKRQEETGQIFPVFWTGTGLIIGLPLVVYFLAGQPLDWIEPTRTRFNLSGGMVVRPEFMAVLIALSLYTAAFISEIVRAGILAVHKGQSEAAFALGLKPSWTMRLIVVPQALRVIIPPLTSQYLNLTKNSSLAYAIGYAELVAVFAGISLNQTGKEIEIMAMTAATYLVISLLISLFMNWYNARVRLVER